MYRLYLIPCLVIAFFLISTEGHSNSDQPKRTQPKSPISIPAEVSISGQKEAPVGSLVVLTPEGVNDARSIWDINYPERFEEFQEENGKLFIAMPAETISFTLLVVPNDVNKPLRKIRHTIKPLGGSKPDPGKPPKEEGDFTSSPLYQTTITAYSKVSDTEKKKWAMQMSESFLHVANRVKDGVYSDVPSMMGEVQKANRGELGIGEKWSEESRKKWTEFRKSISDALDKLDQNGSLSSPKDYEFHWRAIASALRKAIQ